ncbi:hypothetical protein [Aquiflexum sp.]|uniref:hypothetical protein n=1 Tax=Aquiflexum sp. TaxID=1872584 RepID=UPI00359473C6
MKTTLITSKSISVVIEKLIICLSYILVFSILASCSSFYKLNWEPHDAATANYPEKRNQDFEGFRRNKLYRIMERDSIQHLVLLKDFDDQMIYGIDYTESDYYPKGKEKMVKIDLKDIQEIEVKYNSASKALWAVGAVGFVVGMVAIFGIEFFLPEDDDI